MGLLCPECHQKHADGKDIVLSDGNKKRHYQELTEEQKEAKKAVEKKKAKNKAKNERRKARKAEAKKKAEEEKSDEDQEEDESEDKSKSMESESISVMKKLNASLESLPAKLAAMASAKKVSFAEAAEANENQDVQNEDSPVKSGGENSSDAESSSVIKNLLAAWHRADGAEEVKANLTISQGSPYIPK